jgi:FO synthase
LIAIKAKFPQIHVHAFSPMEIMYGTRRTGMSYRDYLTMLRDAGLGTVPGTAAEILDDEVREILSHKKVDVRTWIDIITTAHELGLRSSSTIMYGHIETPAHLAHHIALLRSIQKQTGGFTEFVPLRFTTPRQSSSAPW